MAPSIAFLENLRRSRLVSDDRLRQLDARLSAQEGDTAELLVREGVLTSFQAEKIAAGQVKGLVLGQYHVLQELGKGGFGSVYKARHTVMDRVVALKVIAGEVFESERARKTFRREVLALTNLYHPNIVMAFDANEVDDHLYLVMEYIDGPDLQNLVKNQGPLNISKAAAMLYQAARALQYAHERGLVHRDIKPANLLVPRESTLPSSAADLSLNQPVLVKVADFGLAKLPMGALSSSMVSRERGFIGTPDYVSPEQARNTQTVDIRSDLYSLGCTFYYALTGHKPFKASNVLEVVVQHLEKEPTPIEHFRPEIPPALGSVVRRLMAKSPDKRFQSPVDLIIELTFLLGGNLPAPRSSGMLPVIKLESPPEEENELPVTRVVPSAPAVVAAPPPEPAPRHDSATAFYPRPAPEGTPVPSSDNRADHLVDPPANESTQASAPDAAAIAARPATVADLQLFWNEWKRTVEQIRQGRTPSLSAVEYRQLHAALLQTARAAQTSAEPTRQSGLLRLQELVAPWLTFDVLVGTERQTLGDVLTAASALDRQLQLAPAATLARTTIVALVATFAAGTGLFFLLLR